MAEVPMDNRERNLAQYNNSFAAKSSLTQKPADEEPKPKLNGTIQGGLTLKQKTPGQRFRERFIKTDLNTVGSALLDNVIVPAILDTIYKAGMDALSMLVYGDTRASRTGGLKTIGGGIFRDYTNGGVISGVSNSRSRDRVDNVRPEDSPRYNNLVFEIRGDAENILWNMRDYINTYDSIQIIKLYELVREQTGVDIQMSASDARFGWSDLTNAGVKQIRGGYLLDLPNPIILDN